MESKESKDIIAFCVEKNRLYEVNETRALIYDRISQRYIDLIPKVGTFVKVLETIPYQYQRSDRDKFNYVSDKDGLVHTYEVIGFLTGDKDFRNPKNQLILRDEFMIKHIRLVDIYNGRITFEEVKSE